MVPKAASQMRVAFSNIAWKTGSSSPGELEIAVSTWEVAVCCSRASASSRVRSSSCFFNSISELGPLLTCALAFVPVERSLRPRVGLFAPLRDKVTPWAQPLVPPSSRARQRPSLSILTEPHDELTAPHHSITSSARASTEDGISRPSAFAVFRLITSSYLVGACTRSAAPPLRPHLLLKAGAECEVPHIGLILLCHKFRCLLRAAQHGQRESVVARAATNLRRIVAIEFGTWRSGRNGGSSGLVTFA